MLAGTKGGDLQAVWPARAVRCPSYNNHSYMVLSPLVVSPTLFELEWVVLHRKNGRRKAKITKLGSSVKVSILAQVSVADIGHAAGNATSMSSIRRSEGC